MHSMDANPDRPGTVVRRLQTATSPFLLSEPFAVPRPPACVARYSTVDPIKAPCRLTLTGTITNMGEMDYTRLNQNTYYPQYGRQS